MHKIKETSEIQGLVNNITECKRSTYISKVG